MSSSSWTDRQNKLFEKALAKYDKDKLDYWQNVARAVGDGKTVDDVKRQFKELVRDVDHIESTGGQNSQYDGGSSSGSGIEQR
jgi:polygalacturonase